MENELDPEKLRETAEEIRRAVMPKSVTPEMVGGILLGVVDAVAEVSKRATTDVLTFDARCAYTGIITPATSDGGGAVLYDTLNKRFILAQSRLPVITPGLDSEIGTGSGSDLETVAPGSGLGTGTGSGHGIVMGVSLINDGADLTLLGALLSNATCYASWPGSELYNNEDGHPHGNKVYIQGTPTIARIYDGSDLVPVGSTDSEDITRAADGKLSLTERAKRAHFADLWLAAGNVNGKQYSSVNDDLSEWTLNGIKLTYAEAMDVWLLQGECCAGRYFPGAFYNNTKIRTLFPIDLRGNINKVSFLETFCGCSALEKLVFINVGNSHVSDLRWAFSSCSKLREIEGYLEVSGVYGTEGFWNCLSLETVYIKNLNASVSLAQSSKITLASLEYLVNNAANTKAITVTVHPDVYAKLTNETNDEWQLLLLDAMDKNIQFATTN